MGKYDSLREALVRYSGRSSSPKSPGYAGDGELPGKTGMLEMSESGGRESYFAEIAPGVFSDARAARLLGNTVIRTEPERWSVHLVKARLREAAKGAERIVGRVGPSGAKGYWPSPLIEWGDLVAIAGARATGAALLVGGASEVEVSRIEQALGWPARYLGDDRNEKPRMALKVWLWCEAKNKSFGEQCAELGCGRSAAYERRDKAFEAILAGVVADGVLP